MSFNDYFKAKQINNNNYLSLYEAQSAQSSYFSENEFIIPSKLDTKSCLYNLKNLKNDQKNPLSVELYEKLKQFSSTISDKKNFFKGTLSTATNLVKAAGLGVV